MSIIIISEKMAKRSVVVLKEIAEILDHKHTALNEIIDLLESSERHKCEMMKEKAIQLVNGETSCEEILEEVENFFDYFIVIRNIYEPTGEIINQSRQSNSLFSSRKFMSKLNECSLNQTISLCAVKNKQYFTLMFT